MLEEKDKPKGAPIPKRMKTKILAGTPEEESDLIEQNPETCTQTNTQAGKKG